MKSICLFALAVLCLGSIHSAFASAADPSSINNGELAWLSRHDGHSAVTSKGFSCAAAGDYCSPENPSACCSGVCGDFACRGSFIESISIDYGALAKHWYKEGIETGNGQLVMDMIAENIQWWCFGPAGFTMNDYYSGKAGSHGINLFFQRLMTELGPDTPDNFQIKKMDVQGNVVTVYGVEIRPISALMRTNAPALKGNMSYNYFTHRLEFDLNGKIEKFRCNWALSDTPAAVSPF